MPCIGSLSPISSFLCVGHNINSATGARPAQQKEPLQAVSWQAWLDHHHASEGVLFSNAAAKREALLKGAS